MPELFWAHWNTMPFPLLEDCNMGLFKNFFGKKEPKYKILIPYFQEAFNLLIEFCIEQTANNNSSNSVEIGTSASALVAASYFVNTVGLQNLSSPEREQLTENILDISNSFFDYTSGALAKVAEREMGRKIDIENLEGWLYPVTEKQQNKVGRYILAIINSLKKNSSGGAGFDITIAVTEDMFGKAEPDLIFHLKLISFIHTVGI
jgi:hypothetical protein